MKTTEKIKEIEKEIKKKRLREIRKEVNNLSLSKLKQKLISYMMEFS